MKLFIYIHFLLFGFCVYAQNALSVNTLDFPPFYQEYYQNQGIACDILREVFKSENQNVTFNFIPPVRMLHEIKNHITLCGIGRTLQQEKSEIIVSDSLFNVRQVFIYDTRVYPNGVNFTNLSELKNYRIGVLNKSQTETHLATISSLSMFSNNSNAGLVKQLTNKRIDLWATVDIAGLMLLKVLVPNEFVYFKSTKTFLESEINVIVPIDLYNGKELIEKINKGINTIKSNGRYQQIIDVYLSDYNVYSNL